MDLEKGGCRNYREFGVKGFEFGAKLNIDVLNWIIDL